MNREKRRLAQALRFSYRGEQRRIRRRAGRSNDFVSQKNREEAARRGGEAKTAALRLHENERLQKVRKHHHRLHGANFEDLRL